MTQRVCATAGCHARTSGRHCTQHAVRLGSVYNRRWRQHVRPLVLARDGYLCRYCGQPAKPNEALDAAHLDETQELLRQGRDVFNLERIVAAHRSCHNRHAPHLQRGGVPGETTAPGASRHLENLTAGSGAPVASGVFYAGAS